MIINVYCILLQLLLLLLLLQCSSIGNLTSRVMLNTSISWVVTSQLPDFATITDAPDLEAGLSAEYNGTELDGWPYFHVGLEYWVIVVFVVFFGLVGNILSCFLLMDSQFSALSYPVYLKALVLSDSTQLVIKLVEETEAIFGYIHISHWNDVMCKAWQYVRYFTLQMSPWLVVGLSLDRLVCVLFPLTRDLLCTKKKALLVCCSLAVIFASILMPILVSLKLEDGLCGGREITPGFLALFIAVRLILSSTLPCVLIFVFNAAIIGRIHRSATFRKTFISTSTSGRNKQDGSTRPLVLISVVAFITLLPFSITECVQILVGITMIDMKAYLLTVELWPIFHLVYTVTFGVNFYILMATSSNYRTIIAKKMESVCARTEPMVPRRLTNMSPPTY